MNTITNKNTISYNFQHPQLQYRADLSILSYRPMFQDLTTVKGRMVCNMSENAFDA